MCEETASHAAFALSRGINTLDNRRSICPCAGIHSLSMRGCTQIADAAAYPRIHIRWRPCWAATAWASPTQPFLHTSAAFASSALRGWTKGGERRGPQIARGAIVRWHRLLQEGVARVSVREGGVGRLPHTRMPSQRQSKRGLLQAIGQPES